MTSTLHIDAWVTTDTGRVRKHNEDSLAFTSSATVWVALSAVM